VKNSNIIWGLLEVQYKFLSSNGYYLKEGGKFKTLQHTILVKGAPLPNESI